MWTAEWGRSERQSLERGSGGSASFRFLEAFDILPAMNGRDSSGVPAGFAGISGFLPQPPYFSGGLR